MEIDDQEDQEPADEKSSINEIAENLSEKVKPLAISNLYPFTF